MNGSVVKQENTQWIPPVDAVLEMHSGTSPAEIYPDTVWTQLKNCIIIAAGDTFKAGKTGGQAQISLTTSNLAPPYPFREHFYKRRTHAHDIRLCSKQLGLRPRPYGISR